MQIIVVIIPGLADIFKLVPLNKIQWLYTIGISILPIVIVELQKKLNEIKFGKVVYNKYEENQKAYRWKKRMEKNSSYYLTQFKRDDTI